MTAAPSGDGDGSAGAEARGSHMGRLRSVRRGFGCHGRGSESHIMSLGMRLAGRHAAPVAGLMGIARSVGQDHGSTMMHVWGFARARAHVPVCCVGGWVGGCGRGGGGVGTRPRYQIVCLWRRLLASRHCSF